MTEPIKRALTEESAFWPWFAKCLEVVAGKAWHWGWRDATLQAAHPDASWPPEDVQRGWYTGSGFEPEYVATLYTPPFGIVHEDVDWLRRMSFTTLDRTEAEAHQEWLQSFLVRIAALLPEKK